MKLRLAALALAIIAFAPVSQAQAQPTSAEACMSAAAGCLHRLALKPGRFGLLYANRPLDRLDPTDERAVIMIHGALRNADSYFDTAMGSAFLGGALDRTLVIAPAFHSAAGECKDRLQPGEVSWSCGGDSWRSGGAGASDPDLTSYGFIDALVRQLADARLFPRLRSVTIVGHSAGGQFVARYAMANRIDGQTRLKLEYIVANPSSYAWPDATRPLPAGDGAPMAAAAAWKSETPHTEFSYGPYDSARAPDYDDWPYGLEKRASGYTRGVSDDQLRTQLAARPITYLLSQVDVLPLGGFDDSPEAMAQGPTRRARGEAYVKYVNERLGGKGRIVIVPECGHNARCVFTTDEGLHELFPPHGPPDQARR